jgi:hypothetical protein
VKTILDGRRRVVLGEGDRALTPRAGLHLVAEVDRILGVAVTLDRHIPPIKAREQGLSESTPTSAASTSTP